MSEWEDGMMLEPLGIVLDEGPCCERCGCPVDPAFAERTWEGFLCMDCYEDEEQSKREE